MGFRIRGRRIKNPSTFRLERYNVTTMERLSNADMVGDLIAKKLKFYFTYSAISAGDLNDILELIWDADGIFFPLEYDYNGTVQTADVYVGSIPSELHRAGTNRDTWVWKNVSFNLIQR